MDSDRTARIDLAMRQLPLPGVLVLVAAPSLGPLAADNVGWHRAVAQAGLPRATKLVALVLSSHVQPAGAADAELPPGVAFCSPGLAVLVEQTGYSRTHVQRQLGKLRQLGWLGPVGRPAAGRPARFVLTLPEDVASRAAAASAAGSAPTASPQVSARPTAPGRQSARTGGLGGQRRPNAGHGDGHGDGHQEAASAGGRSWKPLTTFPPSPAPAPAWTPLPARVGRPAAARVESVSGGAPDNAPNNAPDEGAVEWDGSPAQIAEDDGPLTATGKRARVVTGRHAFRRRGGRPADTSKAAARRRAQAVGALLGGWEPTPVREDASPGRLADELLARARLAADEPITSETGETGPARAPRASSEHAGTEAATSDPAPSGSPISGSPISGPVVWPTPSPVVAEDRDSAERDTADGGPEAGTRPGEPGRATTAAPAPSVVGTAAHGPASAGPPERTAAPTAAGHPTADQDGPVTGTNPGPEVESSRVPGEAETTDAKTTEAAGAEQAPAAAEPADPVVAAARQVISALAQAMRCEPDAFADSFDGLTDILREGGWDAPSLATHLVHVVVGGVKVGSDSPADNLSWRLQHLPRTGDQCPCGACRGWRTAQARSPRPAQERRGDENGGAPTVLPDVAEIERAAALGAQQAALLARARAS